MGKVKESYGYDRLDDWHSGKRLDYNNGRNARTPAEKPENTTRRKKRAGRFDDFEGQMSFIADGTELRINPEEEKYRRRAAKRKEDILAYYEAFHEMLNRYGKLNIPLNLLECIETAQENGTLMSDEVRSALNNHYGGELEQLEKSVGYARKRLKDARKSFAEKAEAVDLDDPEINRYIAEYREKDRRDRYRKIINREKNKVACMEPTDVLEAYDLWRPYDFEVDYQMLRAKRERNTEAIKRGEKKPRKKPKKS